MDARIIDSHHHFWKNPTTELYPWMTDELAQIRRTFGPQQLRPHLDECGVAATVLVQTRSSVEETRDFLDLAAATDFVTGVVGWVDLTAPDVAESLQNLRSSPGGNFLVGIRHQVHDEPDPCWLVREDVLRGLKAVDETQLCYDLLVRPRELPAALQVAQQFPRLRLVVDHIAKPPIATGMTDEWVRGLAAIAQCPNVYCKLSGMVTEADWHTWTEGDLQPYVERVLSWFGPHRLMYGSDWPVCLLAAAYDRVMTSCRSMLASLPAAEQAAIFGANATRFYNLEGAC